MLLDPFWGKSEPECLVLQAFPSFGLFLWLRLLPAEELGQQGTADAGLRRCLALLGKGVSQAEAASSCAMMFK